MMARTILLALTLAVLGFPACGDDAVRGRNAALLERGNAALARAMELDGDDAARPSALREASAAYRTVLDDGLDGPALRMNLASIDAQLARRGQAVVNLRAAGKLAIESGDDSSLRSASAALRALRPGAGRAWPPDIMPRVPRLALEAAHSAGAATLLAVFAGCWSIGWLVVALRAAKIGPKTPHLISAALLLAGALTGTVLATAAVAETGARSFAVIVRDGSTLRAGPGEAFEAVATPAGEGADVRIVDHRAGWARVRTATGVSAWIDSGAIQRVVTGPRRR